MSYSSPNRTSDNRPASRVNREVKSLLAKLLAAEGIRVVHSASAVTATWSGKTRTLTLPIWKEMSGDIYDMLCLHEVGHVKYTPAENSREVAAAVKSMTNGKKHLAESAFGFLNICEDTRIERLMKLRFAGAARSFSRGYKWLTDTNTWKVPSPKSLKFIDRVNVHYKIGHSVTVSFSAEEQRLVDRLATVQTFNDMVEVATAMYRLAQEQKKQDNTPPQQPQGEPGLGEQGEPGEEQQPQDNAPANTDIPDEPDENGPKDTRSEEDDTDDGDGADWTDGDGDSDGESSDGKSDRNKPEDKDESSDDTADGKSSDSDDDGSESDKDSDGSESGDDDDSKSGDKDGANGDDDGDDTSSATSREGGKGSENDNAPDAPETTAGLDEAMSSLVDRAAVDRTYVNIPKAILKNMIQDHKELHKSFADDMRWQYEKATAKAVKDLAAFEKESKPVVNLMAKRFDLKKAADSHRRTMTSKTGRINPAMLYAYKLTEDIFLRQTTVSDGKNHGLVMFIDWSSSMDHIMSKTLKQMMNLAMFCRRVGMPFEVYGFSDSDSGNDKDRQIEKDGDFRFGSLTLHNWLSGRMNAREFRTAMLHVMMMVRYFTRRSHGRYSTRRSSSTLQIPYRFTLGGTPLDDAIVAAMSIVPKFQSDNEIQIVNTIFLTDGCSSRSPIYDHAGGRHNTNDRLIVHDPVTKTDYDVADFDIQNASGYSYWGSSQATAMLLTILRDRTDSNVIGFYLLSPRSGGDYTVSDISSEMGNASPEDLDREWKRFQKDKFAIATSKGYSEYYLIPGDLDAVTDVLADASAEAFTKMNRSKRVNRVLLHRFVDMISA